jgi:hypothetical protein
MANCSQHPETPAVAECRTCARSLCEACRRDVRGVSYCEECLAAKIAAPPAAAPPRDRSFRLPTAKLPNPTLAAFLGIIPGVGAAYNGQYEKGLLHVLMFPMLISMVSAEDIFGFLIPIYFLYMIADAYKTAAARVQGVPPPDYLGLRTLLGSANKPISAAFGLDTDDAVPAKADPEATRAPLGAVVLIVLGVVLLVGNMGWIPRRPFATFWPIILVVIGFVQGRRRLQTHSEGRRNG